MEEGIEEILEESRRAYEEQELRRATEEQELRRLILEIEKSEEEERQRQELRRRREVALEEEEARRRQKELKQLQEQEEATQTSLRNEEYDEEYQAAIRASLTSHDQERNRHHHNQRTHLLLESLEQPLPGRCRQCIEIPKDAGQLVVGVHHHHTKDIARRAGGDCKIRLLPRNISINFDGQMGNCLLIEASNPESVEIAATWLVNRVADLFFQDTQIGSSRVGAQVKNSRCSVDSRGSKPAQERRKTHQDVLERLPSFHPPASQKRSIIPQPTNSTAIVLHPEIRRHIIVDSSNIFIGAQTRPGNLDSKINLDSTKLAKLLIKNMSVQGTRVIAGSVPAARNPSWQHWEHAGFRIRICHFEKAEDMVDEFLHAQAMNVVMERHGDQPGQNTLVLCTGDGNDNQGFSNFVNVARNSARMGWRVEIWSWQHCRSQNFVSLTQEFPDRVLLYYLDAFLEEIMLRSHGVKNHVQHHEANTLKQGDKKNNHKNPRVPQQLAKNQRPITSKPQKKSMVPSPQPPQIRTPPNSTILSPSNVTPLSNDFNRLDIRESAQVGDVHVDLFCMYCQGKPRTHMLLPCSHLIACGECIQIFSPGIPCPLCSYIVSSTTRCIA